MRVYTYAVGENEWLDLFLSWGTGLPSPIRMSPRVPPVSGAGEDAVGFRSGACRPRERSQPDIQNHI